VDEIELKFTANRNSTSPTKGSVAVVQGGSILDMATMDVANKARRRQFVDDLVGKHPGLDTEQVRRQLDERLMELGMEATERRAATEAEDYAQEADTPLAISRDALSDTDPELVRYAEQLLKSPNLIDIAIDHAHRLGVAGEDDLIVALYIVGTSRLLSKPLAAIVLGQSSTGKSFCIDVVAKLFPNETVLRAHQISPKALQYLPPGSLVHRFVVAGERSRLQDDAAAEATRALREMISDGRLSALVSATQKSGPHTTVHVEQEGPIAYVESTTLGVQQIFSEDRTRFLLLCANESAQQTRAIIDRIADSASQPGDLDTPDSIIALHHAAQRLLEPLHVTVPFARALRDSLPAERVEARRTFGHLMSLIQAVALLFQKQRDRDGNGQVIATVDDYEIVRRYLVRPLATALGKMLTPGAEQLLDVVSQLGEFTVQDARAAVPGLPAENTVRGRIKELVAAGQVEVVEEGRGRVSTKYRVISDASPPHGLALPALGGHTGGYFLSDSPTVAADKP